jgi:hypothetical protein
MPPPWPGFWAPPGWTWFLRLSAFILICIGIQILWSGYQMLTAVN